MNPRYSLLRQSRLRLGGLVLSLAAVASTAYADAPGSGLTARFEVDFLRSIIDHHFSALRMTELAAGTDPARDPAVPGPNEGTSGTPGFGSTRPKSQMDELKSMSRRENRAQREEIQTAQRFLKQWYATDHEPALTPTGRRQIQLLEAARPGADFDHLFMETMSRHHYTAVTMATECLVASDLKHSELHRYCAGIQHAQVNDIADLRNMLCERMHICDYQPLRGLKGRHSGSHQEATADSD